MTKNIFRSGFALAAALILLGGCVPDEDEFKTDHPFGAGISLNGRNLTCPSSLTGSGTSSIPDQLGTPPSCFESFTSITQYYSVVLPFTGIWFFQLVNMTGDFDIVVYSGTTFTSSTILGSSSNSGTTNDVYSDDLTSGTGGIKVTNFGGSFNFYRLEVVQ